MRNLIATLLIIVITAFATVPANAQRVNLDGLSDEQIAQLQLQAVQMKNKAVNKVTPEDVENYAAIGKGVAEAISVTVKELGVTVNDFATTPMGYFAIFLILWSLFGSMMIHIVGAVVFFTVMISLWFYMGKRWMGATLEQETYQNNDGKTVTKKSWDYSLVSTDAKIGNFAMLVVIVGITLIMAFSY